MKRIGIFIALTTALSILGTPAAALDTRDVLVVYNSTMSASQGVARYYQQARLISDYNVLGCPMSQNDYVYAQNYVQYIATPISNYLSTHPNIRVIMLCYGVPYHIECVPWALVSLDSAPDAGIRAEQAACHNRHHGRYAGDSGERAKGAR